MIINDGANMMYFHVHLLVGASNRVKLIKLGMAMRMYRI